MEFSPALADTNKGLNAFKLIWICHRPTAVKDQLRSMSVKARTFLEKYIFYWWTSQGVLGLRFKSGPSLCGDMRSFIVILIRFNVNIFFKIQIYNLLYYQLLSPENKKMMAWLISWFPILPCSIKLNKYLFAYLSQCYCLKTVSHPLMCSLSTHQILT